MTTNNSLAARYAIQPP